LSKKKKFEETISHVDKTFEENYYYLESLGEEVVRLLNNKDLKKKLFYWISMRFEPKKMDGLTLIEVIKVCFRM